MTYGRRFAEFVASVLTLQSGFDSFGIGGGGDSMVLHDLQLIRNEMIGKFTSHDPDLNLKLCHANNIFI
jgi:hypothetical protein